MWVHTLADATPACGGKAMGLSKLIRAGLPVPDGFAIEDAAFRAIVGELAVDDESIIGHALGEAERRVNLAELPADFTEELLRRAHALGPRITVRSSATIEDRSVGSAAGVFSSLRRVPPDEVVGMVRAVWASALTPLAAHYARRHGGRVAIGVIVQRFVEGELTTIYTRPPGKPTADAALVQRKSELSTVPRAEVPLALRAEEAIGAAATGADVELVGGHVVQARPIVHPPATAPRVPVPPALLASLVADGRTWTWDIGHNPDPLSPAQVGLVERVDRAGVTPYAMRVCAGYLYTAPRDEVPRPAAASTLAQVEEKMAGALGLPRRDGGDGPWAWHDTPPEAPSLAEAIERYVVFAGIYPNEMTPLVATTVRTGARPSSVERLLLAAARTNADRDATKILSRLANLSPAWDVAAPTYGERPGVLSSAVDRMRAAIVSWGLGIDEGREPPPIAGADLAERDDIWFARAQLLVRRAILARADELGIDRDDAFWIPLDELLDGKPLDPDEVRRRASAQRAASERASRWEMPLVVGGPPPPVGESLRGVGTGPRVVGRVVRFATLASSVTVGHGDIVVARAVTPALAVQVVGCAALVSETGGLLDHGAALARELGITCVVGCRDAWSRLLDGMIVIVDGEQGSVEITETSTS